MTYHEALDYLNSLVNYERIDDYDYRKSFKIETILHLSSLLGDPHKKIRSIHVAGTKGKGSTCAMVQSILASAGYKVGLYTSPHLESFRERIRINDTLISESDVGELMERLKRAVESLPSGRVSFFEAYTALAYLYFEQMRPDFVVYEAGLGGSLDATNILEPLVCAITPISYDHVHILGDTLTKIATEKAGIIKDGSVCVSAPQDEEALDVIEKKCAEKDSSLILVGRDITFEEMDADDETEKFTINGLFGQYKDLRMGLLGSHQVANAALAVGVTEALRLSGINISADAIRKGLSLVKWPGRLELIKLSPRVLLDGAQNHASAQALSRALRRLFKYRKLILVLGVSKDKDIKGILKELVPISDRIVLTKSKISQRAMPPEDIKKLIIAGDRDVVTADSVEDALAKASSNASGSDLVLVTGSLFVVGEARAVLCPGGSDE